MIFFCEKNTENICRFIKKQYFCAVFETAHDSVAQLVEQLTLNQWVVSSSLTGVTKKKETMIRFLFF